MRNSLNADDKGQFCYKGDEFFISPGKFFPPSDRPFFSYSSLLSNISLPAILTDENLIYYGSNDSIDDFRELVYFDNGKVNFNNSYVQKRFKDFSLKVSDVNPRFFSIRDSFSIFANGLFKKIINFKSITDIFDINKIIISIVSFDIQRNDNPYIFEDLFGFNHEESRLAILLMSGKSVIECAEETGMRISTVRENMGTMFAKTRTSQQTELVLMLSRLDLIV